MCTNDVHPTSLAHSQEVRKYRWCDEVLLLMPGDVEEFRKSYGYNSDFKVDHYTVRSRHLIN